MKPLIRQSTPEEAEAAKREAEREARRQRDSDAWDALRKRLNLPEVAPRPSWQGRMFPAGTPNPRDALRREYMSLRRMVYGEVMPPEYRQFLGPPPSSPASRLYEGLRNETARELAAQLRNYPGHEEATRKGPQEKGPPIDPSQ